MDPERFQRVRRIFDRALELPGEERAAFLDDACGGDQELRGAVERLLEHDPSAVGFASTVVEIPAPTPARPIGPYRLLRVLGEGGMGVVWEARQEHPFERTAIAHTIVHGNSGGDLLSVPCANVSWSVVGTPDCSAVNDNLELDCLLDADYRMGDGSPCLDTGPLPSSFTGEPCLELDGGPRLQDFDGDGLAQMDPGAYERVDPSPVPGEGANFHWVTGDTLGWDTGPSAAGYHVYRGTLAALGYPDYGACRDDLDPNGTDEQLTDLESPGPGEGFFYLVTIEDGSGAEGAMGTGTCAAISNFLPCR